MIKPETPRTAYHASYKTKTEPVHTDQSHLEQRSIIFCQGQQVGLFMKDYHKLSRKIINCQFFCGRTLNDGQQDNNDEEEESDVKDDAVELVLVTIRGLNLVANATTSPYSLVQVEHKALPKQTTIYLLVLCHSGSHKQSP